MINLICGSKNTPNIPERRQGAMIQQQDIRGVAPRGRLP